MDWHDDQSKEWKDPQTRERLMRQMQSTMRKPGKQMVYMKIRPEIRKTYENAEKYYRIVRDAFGRRMRAANADQNLVQQFYTSTNNLALAVKCQETEAKLKEAEKIYRSVLTATGPPAPASCKISVLQNLISLYGFWDNHPCAKKPAKNWLNSTQRPPKSPPDPNTYPLEAI